MDRSNKKKRREDINAVDKTGSPANRQSHSKHKVQDKTRSLATACRAVPLKTQGTKQD